MRILLFIACLFPLALKGQDATTTWQDFTIGTPTLKMSLPGKPVPQKPNLPQSVQTYIKNYTSFYLKDVPKGLVLTIMYVEYAVDVLADPEGALGGTNGQWEKTGSIVSITTTEESKVSGRRALKQKGKLIMGNETHDFSDIVIVHGDKLWQVIIMVKSNDDDLKAMSQKIVSSLTF
jgi:hypothetical protein